MMNIKRLILLAFLLTASWGFAQSPTTHSETITGKFGTYYDQRELLFESLPTSPSDIIFLGNSITDGAEWNEVFQNPHCKNRGISGDIIPGVLNRLETVTKGKPAMIFLMIGTNDINWGYSNDTIALGVRTIVRRIKEASPTTHIVIQSILPTNDCYGMFSGHTKRWQDVAVINGMLRTIAIEEEVDYLDLYHPFATEEGKLNPKYSNDGLHLNGEGYALWKAIIEDNYGDFPRPVYQSCKVPVWLNAGTGTNIAHCFDQGASPLPYVGIGLNIRTGVNLQWDDSYVSFRVEGFGNVSFSKAQTEIFDLGIEMEAEYLYRFHQARDLHLWVGGAFSEYFSVNYAPQLMNAALGYSNFVNWKAVGMVQYDFAKYNRTHNLLSAYAKLSLPLFGFDERPGFAYIDNYTESLNTSATQTNTRDSFTILFPGVGTDVGIFLNLLNNNKIGLSYRWNYLTTRHLGSYRFDHATHSLNLTYLFNIN